MWACSYFDYHCDLHRRNGSTHVVAHLTEEGFSGIIQGKVDTKYETTKVPTKSAKVAFSPGIKLSILSYSSTVSVASRRTNNNLAEIENK